MLGWYMNSYRAAMFLCEFNQHCFQSHQLLLPFIFSSYRTLLTVCGSAAAKGRLLGQRIQVGSGYLGKLCVCSQSFSRSGSECSISHPRCWSRVYTS